MKFDLQGKRVLVAGGGAGLGRAMALGFASEGARVAICERDDARLQQAFGAIRQSGADALAAVVSETDSAAVKVFVQRMVDCWGGIDILVNALGNMVDGTLETLGAEPLLDSTDRMQIAQFRFSQAVLPHMRAQNWGRIIDLHDAVTSRVDSGNLAATLNNTAGIALSRSLGMYFAGDNILANALNVGFVSLAEGLTPAIAAWSRGDESPDQWIADNIPLGRPATADEIVAFALFLASDHSSYIAAASIDLAGGLSTGPGSLSNRPALLDRAIRKEPRPSAHATPAVPAGPRAPSVAARRVLVTGGTRGLGLAIARAYARENARIALCARDEAALAEVKAELDGYAPAVLTGVVDVTDTAQVNGFVDDVIAQWGGIDILINNAGHTQFGTIDTLEPEAVLDHSSLMQANHLRFVQAIVPFMRRQGGGRIININSLCVSVVVPGGNGAVINRAACGALSQSLAISLARDNILVNSVNIGFVETPQWADHRRIFAARGESGDQIMDEVSRFIPMKRFGEAHEVAGLAVFLGSDAASYVTGASIDLAGGLGQQMAYFSDYQKDKAEGRALPRAAN